MKIKIQETTKQRNYKIQETINTGNNIKNKTVNTVKCTFDLPIDLVTALKVKSSVERVKMVKILEKTLRDSIESKYFIK